MQESFASNYISNVEIYVTIYSGNQALLLVEVTRDEGTGSRVEQSDEAMSYYLKHLNMKWPIEFAKGVHHLANMTFVTKNRIYLIKPNRVRHWMASTALCDVDRIVSDLHVAKARIS